MFHRHGSPVNKGAEGDDGKQEGVEKLIRSLLGLSGPKLSPGLS